MARCLRIMAFIAIFTICLRRGLCALRAAAVVICVVIRTWCKSRVHPPPAKRLKTVIQRLIDLCEIDRYDTLGSIDPNTAKCGWSLARDGRGIAKTGKVHCLKQLVAILGDTQKMTSGTREVIVLKFWKYVEKVFHRDRSESEIIETPGYPESYPPESHCSWKFEQAAGIWVVVFEDIQIPAGRNQSCVSDYLLITDTKHRHHSSKLCGTLPQKPFVSFGSRIFISFRSDGSAQGRGFRIRVLHQKKRTEWENKSRGITARKQTQTNTDSIVTALDNETVIFIGLGSALLICVLVLLFLVLWMYRHYSYAKTRYTTRNQALDRTQRTENKFMAMMDHRGTNADFHSGVRKFSGPQPKESTCAIELDERKLRVDIPIRTQEMHVMPNQEMVNKSPNVYVQITDSPSPAPLRQAPLDFNGHKLDTDAIKPGQLPLYYKPRDSYQEAKFMGVI